MFGEAGGDDDFVYDPMLNDCGDDGEVGDGGQRGAHDLAVERVATGWQCRSPSRLRREDRRGSAVLQRGRRPQLLAIFTIEPLP